MFAYNNIFICIMMIREYFVAAAEKKHTLLASELNAERTPS